MTWAILILSTTGLLENFSKLGAGNMESLLLCNRKLSRIQLQHWTLPSANC